MKIPEDIREVLENPGSIKMIGTVDSNLNINLEPVKKIKITGDDLIAFACFGKNDTTRKNILQNRHGCLAIFQPAIIGFKLNGIVKSIEEKAEDLKQFEKMYAENRITGIIKLRITEIYALTMAIAGDKII